MWIAELIHPIHEHRSYHLRRRSPSVEKASGAVSLLYPESMALEPSPSNQPSPRAVQNE